VFAVPGSILSQMSRGTNHLIQEGAKLVRCTTDILEELNLTQAVHQVALKEVMPETDTESRLLKSLNSEPTHIDEVCRSSGLPIAEVSATLAMMELKGMIKQVASMSYVLARELREEYRARVE
jgi:DNA processing protein